MEEIPIDAVARRQIAEGLLGEIDPVGYCHCPGAHLHTNKSAAHRDRPGRDCRVYLDRSERNPRGVPSIKCVHTSCEGVVAELNHRLRSDIARHEARQARGVGYLSPAPRRRRRTKEDIARQQRDRAAAGLAMRSSVALERIVEEEWERVDMWECSMEVCEDPLGQARTLLGLFRPRDIVWCGEHQDSISVEDQEDVRCRARLERVKEIRPFRRSIEWIESGSMPGPRICPNAFRAGVLARSNESVSARRFFVVEHDRLTLGAQGAVLRWLWRSCGLSLRAIVFTGGKSLHGWFECPPPSILEELQVMLCGFRKPGEDAIGGMGFDPATFVPSQAYRVPGWSHEKTGQAAELWFWR